MDKKLNEPGKMKVLIVDDEEGFRIFLKKLLSKGLEVDVTALKNPKEGFEYLKDNTPTMIMLDMQMPIMDGQTMLMYIRKNKRTRNTPVIVVSALRNESLFENLVRLKISDYIIKPSTPQTILEKVYDVLKQFDSLSDVESYKEFIEDDKNIDKDGQNTKQSG
jgi:CheY-like chemotaxis protein